jgi:hypothetical protein
MDNIIAEIEEIAILVKIYVIQLENLVIDKYEDTGAEEEFLLVIKNLKLLIRSLTLLTESIGDSLKYIPELDTVLSLIGDVDLSSKLDDIEEINIIVNNIEIVRERIIVIQEQIIAANQYLRNEDVKNEIEKLQEILNILDIDITE